MKVYDANGIEKVTGIAPGKDENYFKQAGTSPNECWYLASHLGGGGALPNGAPAIDTMIALPVVFRRAGVIDQFGINVTTLAAGSAAKVLLYSNVSDTVMYPSAPVSEPAEAATTSTGVKTYTANYQVAESTLLWMVYWCGTLAPTIRCTNVTNMVGGHMIGFDNTLPATYGYGWQVAQTYTSGANPSTFPASATRLTAVPIPALFYRFSS